MAIPTAHNCKLQPTPQYREQDVTDDQTSDISHILWRHVSPPGPRSSSEAPCRSNLSAWGVGMFSKSSPYRDCDFFRYSEIGEDADENSSGFTRSCTT